MEVYFSRGYGIQKLLAKHGIKNTLINRIEKPKYTSTRSQKWWLRWNKILLEVDYTKRQRNPTLFEIKTWN